MRFKSEMLALSLWENLRAWSSANNGTFHSLVFFGGCGLIAVVIFGGAILFHQQPQPRHHRKSKRAAAPKNEEPAGIFSKGRKHRHRRKKHRPVNPTLSDTGGLPPPRAGAAPPHLPI